MPNYCDNYLTIEGNPDTRNKILTLLKSDESCFDFEKVIPMPENIYRGGVGAEEKEIYGENNWYDWSIKNWGTKWNSVDAEVHYNEIYFQTAWSPCDPVIAALAEKFPLCDLLTLSPNLEWLSAASGFTKMEKSFSIMTVMIIMRIMSATRKTVSIKFRTRCFLLAKKVS